MLSLPQKLHSRQSCHTKCCWCASFYSLTPSPRDCSECSERRSCTCRLQTMTSRLRSVKFNWVTPNIDGSLWLMPELQQLCENDTSGLIDASVYYTRCSSEVAAVAQSDYKNINVISGRPNFRAILEELDGTHAQRTNQPLKTHMQGALLQPPSHFGCFLQTSCTAQTREPRWGCSFAAVPH